MSIAIVVGNPKAGSRTLRVAQAVADTLVDRLDDTYELGYNTERFVVDLADVAGELFDYPSKTIDDLLERVAASDLLIAASALVNGMTVVTHNGREFKRIEGLLVEDWQV